MNKVLLSAAVAGLLVAGVSAANAAEAPTKCYGIAKAGENSCANAFGKHACKGMAKISNDGGDFIVVSAESCSKAGGSTTPKK